MNRLFRTAATASLLLGSGLSAPAAAQLGLPVPAHEQPVVIASDPWCPYACDPDADGLEGYMVDLAREVLEAAGYRVEYRIVNFQVLRRMVEDGSATGVPGVGADLDGQLLLPGVPQGHSENAVIVSAESDFAWTGPSAFEARLMAVVRDYNYGGAIQDYVAGNINDPSRILVLSGFGYSHVTQGIRLVSAGRIDLFIDDVNVLHWGIERSKPAKPVKTIGLRDEADLFVGFSKMDPRAAELTRLMTEGTRALRRSGRLKEILDRYGLQDWLAR